MHDAPAKVPWLEFFPPDGGPLRRVELTEFPVTIGRIESASLQIDSSRVSREHAIILRDGLLCRIRDLGSTNGTFLNGQRIEEASLGDGDLLAIADIELSFFSGPVDPPRANVTQVIEPEAPARGGNPASDLVDQVRRLHESATSGGLIARFQRIVSLVDEQTLGYEALGDNDPLDSANRRRVLATECPLTGRLHQLQRLVAAEQATRIPAEYRVFLNVDPTEIGSPGLVESIRRACRTTLVNCRLVVELPDSAVTGGDAFRDLISALGELGVEVAYDQFAGSQAQVAEIESVPPDFLKLARSLVRDIHRDQKRQQQIQNLVSATEEVGGQVIATEVENDDDVQALVDIGCKYAQGPLWGPSLPAHALGRHADIPLSA